jgi:hypothetical protein
MPARNDDSVRALLERTTPRSPPPAVSSAASDEAEPESLTISQMDGHDASMRPTITRATRMHVIKKDGKVLSYQYHFLDAESSFDGGTFTLLFAGVKHWQVKVRGHGPKFWSVYDYISLHRWPYLREATGSMPGVDGETVFTSIEITDVTPQ